MTSCKSEVPAERGRPERPFLIFRVAQLGQLPHASAGGDASI